MKGFVRHCEGLLTLFGLNGETLHIFICIIFYPWDSLVAQLVKNPLAIQLNSWVRKIHWRRDKLPTSVLLGFPCGSAGKESTCNAGGLGLIPGLGRSPGEENSYPLQYSGLKNSMDCIVHGFTENRT